MVELAGEGGRVGVGRVGVRRGRRVGARVVEGMVGVGVGSTEVGAGAGVESTGSVMGSGWPEEVSMRATSMEKSEG